MRGFLFLLLLSAYGPGDGVGDHIDSVVVTASRAGHDTPVPHTTLSHARLKQAGASASIPQALELQPSVVSTSEGGTGLGYTALRIRGVTGSQTGVSLNGIPLNDAESQEVFWVNTPAVANYLGSVQLQRGLGTTACGPGAFGASVNMVTDKSPSETRTELSYGSFGTFTGMISAPLVRKGNFSLAGACSYQRTDGWVRNASARNRSAFAVARWDRGADCIAATILYGHEHTGITWEGIPSEVYGAGDLRYNPAGEYHAPDGSLHHYGNQCDNYRQAHSQLLWKHDFSDSLRIETTFNYTDGYGFYEQYRAASGPDDSVTRDIMDNGFLALRSELALAADRLSLNAGMFVSRYGGDHWGLTLPPSVISGESVPSDRWDEAPEWYRNDAVKAEADLWVRGEWRLARGVSAYGEAQLRYVRHRMTGPDEYSRNLALDRSWLFANPRAGVSWRPSRAHRLYLSAALGHREPGRADLQASASVGRERMSDFEAAWEYSLDAFRMSAGLYSMEYRDMLLETGRLNDAGYAVKENTPRAWRRGIEFGMTGTCAGSLELSANIALSTNRIREYCAYVDRYDADWTFLGQKEERYEDVPILLSPSAVASASLCWTREWMSEGFRLDGKFVGSQQWDNTGSADRRVPGYFVCGFSAGHGFRLERLSRQDDSASVPVISLRFDCRNLLGCAYYAYAWVWRAEVAGAPYQSEGLYPQAPRTFALTASLDF